MVCVPFTTVVSFTEILGTEIPVLLQSSFQEAIYISIKKTKLITKLILLSWEERIQKIFFSENTFSLLTY